MIDCHVRKACNERAIHLLDRHATGHLPGEGALEHAVVGVREHQRLDVPPAPGVDAVLVELLRVGSSHGELMSSTRVAFDHVSRSGAAISMGAERRARRSGDEDIAIEAFKHRQERLQRT